MLRPERLKPLAVMQFHSGSVETVAFTPRPPRGGRCSGKQLVVTGGKEGKVALWSVYN